MNGAIILSETLSSYFDGPFYYYADPVTYYVTYDASFPLYFAAPLYDLADFRGNGWNDFYIDSITGYPETTVFASVTITETMDVTPEPIPEPSTWTMLLAGLAGLGLVARARKRRLAAVAG